jgi:hypothetical protein
MHAMAFRPSPTFVQTSGRGAPTHPRLALSKPAILKAGWRNQPLCKRNNTGRKSPLVAGERDEKRSVQGTAAGYPSSRHIRVGACIIADAITGQLIAEWHPPHAGDYSDCLLHWSWSSAWAYAHP